MSSFTFFDQAFLAATQVSTEGSTLLNDLIAWWPLDEASGNYADSHGTNNVMTRFNSAGSSAGVVGNSFDGLAASSHYAEVTGLGAFTAFTVACWIKLDSASVGVEKWITWADSDNTELSWLGSENIAINDTYDFGVGFSGSGTGTTFQNAIGATDALWHCWIITYSGTVAKLFRDAVEVGSFNLSGATWNNMKLTLNRRAWSTTGYGNLQIDEVALASRVWTTDEIAEFSNGIGYPG